jgi:hypothetical protein
MSLHVAPELYERVIRPIRTIAQMASQQLRKALVTFSQSGKYEDYLLLYPLLLVSLKHARPSIDVDLRVALNICEKCVNILENTCDSTVWLGLTFFLYEHTYIHAEALASSFLCCAVGHRAFECVKRSVTVVPDLSHEQCTAMLQFLANALLHESCAAHVLQTESDTYRITFTYIASNCSTFRKKTRVAVLFVFQGVTSGRNDNPLIPGNFENELSVALAAFVFCGGLTPFSAVFWAMCTKLDPTLNETEMRQLFHYCAALFVRFSRTSFPLSLNGCCMNGVRKKPAVTMVWLLATMQCSQLQLNRASLLPERCTLSSLYMRLVSSACCEGVDLLSWRNEL